MSHVYDGDPDVAFSSSSTLPDDADLETAASVNVPFESALDAVAYLKKYAADRIAPLADLATLTAIAAPPNGLVRHVFGYGIYVFQDDSISPADGVQVLAADDSTPGKWILSASFLAGNAFGFGALNASGQLIVPVGGWPTFSANKTRVRSVSLQNFAITSALVVPAKNVPFAPFGGAAFIGDDTQNASISLGAFTFLDAPSGTASQGIQLCIDHYVHDGAQLSQVTAQLAAASGHAGLTLTQVQMGVFRKPKFVGTLTSLQSGGDFLVDTAASTAAYQGLHALTITCDQNHTIDTAAYSYFIQIFNEYGSHALPGLIIQGIEITHTLIADMRFP